MNKSRILLSSKLFVTSVMLATASLFGIIAINTGSRAVAADSPDCSNAAMMKCGFNDAAEFAAKYEADKAKGGDLEFTYQALGLRHDELNQFISGAKWATAYRDGRLVIEDGKVVTESAASVSRQNSIYYPYELKNPNGTSYYAGYNTTALLETDATRALVWLDQSGNLKFAVLATNGNPVFAGPQANEASFQCLQITSNQLSNNKFEFSTSVHQDKAVLKSLHYDFGDGSSQNVATASQKVSKTYTESGKYTVKVTATFTVKAADVDTPKDIDYVEPLQAKCSTVVEAKVEKPAPTTPAQPATTTNAKDQKPAEKQEQKNIAPKSDEKPQQPKREIAALPQTGPAEVLAAALGVSSLGAASAYWRVSRRNITASAIGKAKL